MADLEITTADDETLAGIRAALGTPDAARTLRFPDDEATPPSPVLPAIAARELMLLGFAAGGAPEEVDPSTVGGGGSLTPPVLADFAWVNKGAATAVDLANIYVPRGLLLSAPSHPTDGLPLLVKTLPGAGTWVFRARFGFGHPDANFCHHGFVLRNSGTGYLRLFGLRKDTTMKFQRLNYTAVNVYSAHDAGIALPTPGNQWQRYWDVRLTNNGTNIIGEASPDGGLRWFQFISESKTNFSTPDQIGIYTDRATAYASYLHVTHWEGP